MQDAHTTVQALKDRVQAFVDERQWQHHHRPKHLAMSIAIEAAELMEHFQWTDAEGQLDDPRFKSGQDQAAVAEELCDVLAYVLSMANCLNIDLAQAFEAKMQKNTTKHPAPGSEPPPPEVGI